MKTKILKYNAHFNRNQTLLIFLILLLGILIALFSGKSELNFWINLNDILTNSLSNIFFLIAGIVNTNLYIKDNKNRYYMINRFSSYKELILKNIPDIICMTIYLYVLYLILSIAGSILLSANNFNMISYINYSIPYIVYLPILIIRELTFMIILNLIIYLLMELKNKYILSISVFSIISLFIISVDYKLLIENFYNMYLLFPYYFQNIKYQSLYLEILCSTIEMLILYGIFKFILYYLTKRKRDIL